MGYRRVTHEDRIQTKAFLSEGLTKRNLSMYLRQCD